MEKECIRISLSDNISHDIRSWYTVRIIFLICCFFFSILLNCVATEHIDYLQLSRYRSNEENECIEEDKDGIGQFKIANSMAKTKI